MLFILALTLSLVKNFFRTVRWFFVLSFKLAFDLETAVSRTALIEYHSSSGMSTPIFHFFQIFSFYSYNSVDYGTNMPNSGKRLPAFSADSLLLIHVKLPRSPAHTDHLPSYVRSRQVQTDFQCSASFFLSPSSRHSEPRRAHLLLMSGRFIPILHRRLRIFSPVFFMFKFA